MAVVDINWNPSRKDLRVFAVLQFVFFGIIAAGAWRNGGAIEVSGIVVAVSATVAVLGCMVPALIRPVYIVWMAAVFPIGLVVSYVVLGLAYFLVFTPIGLVMRLCGRDPMQRKFDPNASGYWTPRSQEPSAEQYFRQY